MVGGEASVTPPVRVSSIEGILRESRQFQFRSRVRPRQYRTVHMGDAPLWTLALYALVRDYSRVTQSSKQRHVRRIWWESWEDSTCFRCSNHAFASPLTI